MIEVVCDAEHPMPFDEKALQQAARAALQVAGVEEKPLTVRICSDQTIQKLNAQFRGKDRPTDVLSFPMEEEDYLGDIALAHPFVAEEARRLGVDPQAHAQHLVIHGVLHLLGYDHETDAEAAVMQALERRAMQLLGLHDPYPDREA